MEVRRPLRAALGIIEKLVVETGDLTDRDIAAARDAGIDDEGLRTAIYICVAFSMIVRLADTFDFKVQTKAQFASDARMLLRRGYAAEPG